MHLEWEKIFGVTALVALVLSLCSANTSIIFGWLILVTGFTFSLVVLVTGLRVRRRTHVSLEEAMDRLIDHRILVAVLTGFISSGASGIYIGLYKDDWVHVEPWFILLIAILLFSMVVSFSIARFVATGVENAFDHRKAVYTFFFFYFVTLVVLTLFLKEHYDLGGLAEMAGLTGGMPTGESRLK